MKKKRTQSKVAWVVRQRPSSVAEILGISGFADGNVHEALQNDFIT